ncbi:hypothetical protein [Homoserinimonas sp. A520]
MSLPASPPHATQMPGLALIKRLFSMLDEFTQGEIESALDELLLELEREAAEAALLRARIAAIRAWRQTIRRNTPCWAALGNLAFLETHERVPLRLRADALPASQKSSKHHLRRILEA